MMESTDCGPAVDDVYPYVVGGLLHDALNVLWTTLQDARDAEEEDTADGVSLVPGLEHLERVLRLIQDLSRPYYTSGAAAATTQAESLADLVDGFQARNPSISYVASFSPDFDACGLPQSVATFLVGELVTNATKACAGRDGARIEISTVHRESDYIIRCSDNGPGFDDEMRARIMAGGLIPPSEGETGGYGLYFITEIVHRLKGPFRAVILAPSCPDGGARIEIVLSQRGG